LTMASLAKAQDTGSSVPCFTGGQSVRLSSGDCAMAQWSETKDFERRIRGAQWNEPAALRKPDSNVRYVKFTAELPISNDTTKTIKQVTWELILANPSTTEVIGRHTLVSKTRIAPHTDFTIRESVGIASFLAQARKINRILKIKYTDGSVRTF